MSDTPLTDEAEKLAKAAGCIDGFVSVRECGKIEKLYNDYQKAASKEHNCKLELICELKKVNAKLAEQQNTIDRLNEHCNRLQGYADAAKQLDEARRQLTRANKIIDMLLK